jgi:hypothetical protein
MDFSWTEEQLAFKASVEKFAQKEPNGNLLGRDAKNHFCRENWNECAKFGILGLPIPETYGGTGADILTTVTTMEGLGYGFKGNGLVFAMDAQMWSVNSRFSSSVPRSRSNNTFPDCAAARSSERTACQNLIRDQMHTVYGHAPKERAGDMYSTGRRRSSPTKVNHRITNAF